MVTLDILQKICPQTKTSVLNNYVGPLNAIGQHIGLMDNTKRLAAFLAQVSEESEGFNVISENLNYNATALQNISHGKYFPTSAIALQYAKQPEKIANRMYANRMGNGPESSGDGYMYRGRGLIQITGKTNYSLFAQSIGLSLANTVSYISTPAGATSSAGWFWNVNKLNIYADQNDFVGLTRRINGGTNGLADRQHYYSVALSLL